MERVNGENSSSRFAVLSRPRVRDPEIRIGCLSWLQDIVRVSVLIDHEDSEAVGGIGKCRSHMFGGLECASEFVANLRLPNDTLGDPHKLSQAAEAWGSKTSSFVVEFVLCQGYCAQHGARLVFVSDETVTRLGCFPEQISPTRKHQEDSEFKKNMAELTFMFPHNSHKLPWFCGMSTLGCGIRPSLTISVLLNLWQCGYPLRMSDIFTPAKDIVLRLKKAGFEAFFAGGCVRDRLLGLPPKDIDIATSARPDQVERLFSNTIGVGKQFGVIIVSLSGQNFDVATFRADGNYGDGRHPDEISFSSAKEDVLRRDFTINGLLMDPENDEIIDYVGGRADLAAGVIRTIGDAAARFSEDHLRILRAIRFACRFGFKIEAKTEASIKHLADYASGPSAERIFGELNRMLTEGSPRRALRLLDELGLMQVVLPEVSRTLDWDLPERLAWQQTGTATQRERLALMLSRLSGPVNPELAWAILLADLSFELPMNRSAQAVHVLKRLRASNSLIKRVSFLVTQRDRLLFACRVSQARLKLVAACDDFDLLQAFHGVEAGAANSEFCPLRSQDIHARALPKPLLDGKELMTLGVPKGPGMGRILKRLRFMQLECKISDQAAAIAWIGELFPSSS